MTMKGEESPPTKIGQSNPSEPPTHSTQSNASAQFAHSGGRDITHLWWYPAYNEESKIDPPLGPHLVRDKTNGLRTDTKYQIPTY